MSDSVIGTGREWQSKRRVGESVTGKQWCVVQYILSYVREWEESGLRVYECVEQSLACLFVYCNVIMHQAKHN